MPKYVICPRCELNFIDEETQEYCDVCIKELSGEKTFTDDFEAEEAIEETLKIKNITNCEVIVYDGLVAQYTNENDVKYMIRGLRNNMDYNYEENIAEINKLINPKLEYVYFRAENVAVSSSMVKELNSYNKDVSKFVPPPVWEIMKSGK